MSEQILIEKLVSIRKEQKLTQLEVSKKAGLTQQQVSALENQIRSPRLGTLLKYCDSIGVKLIIEENI